MSGHLHEILARGLLQAGAVLLAAPLAEGVMRKITAVLQSRQGPPVIQPYYDLLKLMGKEDLECGESPWMQRLAGWLALVAPLSVAALWPGIGGQGPAAGDAILLVYLLTLGGVATLLAGLAAGSTYSLLGISREMMTMMVLEPLLAIALLVAACHADSLQLADLFGGAIYGRSGHSGSGLLMLGVLVFAFQAMVSRRPFDMTEAESEIMEGPLMEYSGPKLALLQWARMARLVVSSALMVALFWPGGAQLGFPWAALVFAAKTAAVILAVTVIAATHVRYRVDQAIRYFGGMLLAGLAALGLACFGF
ncbi:MAG TPA: NADH-quinone oxidoreductase subunit H [Candidatus Paceibacterota bacterium]|nr:NADH-quinone oxidoreductase subunit H [Verrucomicrobiota bacterium]HOX00871.1 NADH-quinone oxidoreductase subunit H [Verrucomicrobiota bacterium]HRZ43604.1 NADH-quinone oxidoreductase subunit H [Candidatus Paceibacterota bacterium]HRZ91597.1 NADH-quinone oxidoreductase subunit H [Candidatus Paceibacterota bacterium]